MIRGAAVSRRCRARRCRQRTPRDPALGSLAVNLFVLVSLDPSLFLFLSLSLFFCFSHTVLSAHDTELRRATIPVAFRGRSGTGMTLERGITGVIGPVGRGGRQRGEVLLEVVLRSSRPTESEPPCRRRCPATGSASAGFFLLRWTFFRLLLSPLSLSLSLSFSRTLSLALTLSLSLVLLTGTLGQHPRYTATRSGVAALASSPAVSARKRYSFLPACLPAACLLLACLPVCPPSPFLTLIPSFSVSHPP